MKNLKHYVTREEIHTVVKGLWKSKPFKESYSNGGFVYRLVEDFAWLPRFFAEVTDDNLERAHFSAWWNVIMLRNDYDNPVVNDLYYLHELTHATTMPYASGLSIEAFDAKMQRNELETSVFTEIQVYFELPELRDVSFRHYIYGDRFLNDPYMKALWKNNPVLCIDTIRCIRKNVMLGKPDHLLDEAEKWIRKFAQQNAAFTLAWTRRFNEIEGRMQTFQRTAIDNRGRAVADYKKWLVEESMLDPVSRIPFRPEAELFTPFYWANKTHYCNNP